MKYHSAFDIIGPIMVGPSSSHTAGAVRIGNIARQVLGEEPVHVTFHLMGSFAETYRGHGTDLALLAGVLGLTTESEQVPDADRIAAASGLTYGFSQANLGWFHPNTVEVLLKSKQHSIQLIASSLGGGKVEVQELDGLPVKFSGEKPTLILYHIDQRGFISMISRLLDANGYNIARLALERSRRKGAAITVCEVDEELTDDLIASLATTIPMLKTIRVVKTF
ncbi:L-serine ammonia-lyase, iron-sulfur-dependent subunit beta [Sulfoacidibacillus thermotolerans]|uniref:L-serine deaminase n=1 Tax=Sulfoacidibacillus thermotolerans TaxID=1765684 RepID=A0A2U3D6W8_SULT2|nr:L-serine ammonia-lyase, iron-sulfur-dependent subunit beta [Sulfoacidibacillus thermotolerans]PWI57025.1 L-serine dehydratase, iron-sulfur-dependent subunit beta [Sulfoacidibacillus thermotolerans]